MANIRLPIKHVRDRAKSAYEKKTECYICSSDANLELHHFTPLTRLFEQWCRKRKLKIETDEDVLAIRDEFISENNEAIYVLVVTLCKAHHAKLHSVYGKSPALPTAGAQARWVKKQKDKHDLSLLASGEA